MKIRTHITGTMTNPKIEVDQTWCPGKLDPFIFACTHYSMQVSFPSWVTKYLVCPPIPPLSHLAIIMKKDHGNTACRNSTFLPPPTILFYTSLLPTTLPVHLLSANTAAYLKPPFPDYIIPNPILAYYPSSLLISMVDGKSPPYSTFQTFMQKFLHCFPSNLGSCFHESYKQ